MQGDSHLAIAKPAYSVADNDDVKSILINAQTEDGSFQFIGTPNSKGFLGQITAESICGQSAQDARIKVSRAVASSLSSLSAQFDIPLMVYRADIIELFADVAVADAAEFWRSRGRIGKMKTRIFACLALVSAARLTLGAQPNYFTSTFAGYTPPVINPIAAKQYFSTVGPVAYDATGNLYYSSQTQVWRLNADGTDTLIAGESNNPIAFGDPGNPGSGDPLTADLPEILGLGFDAAQNLYIFAFTSIFKIGLDGKIVFLMSAGDNPGGMAVAPDGTIYLTQFTTNNSLSIGELDQVTPDGRFSTLVSLREPLGVALAGTKIFIMQQTVGLVEYDLSTGSLTTVAPGATHLCLGACVNVAAGRDGYIYFSSGESVERISASAGGAIEQFAGTGLAGDYGDGGPANDAGMVPDSLAVNPITGDLAIAGGVDIRVVNGSTHQIQLAAGLPHSGGDNGPAVLAQFQDTVGGSTHANVAADLSGNVYFFDRWGSKIRKISPAGIITTVAGNGTEGTAGDGGKAVQAEIDGANYAGLAVDGRGNLYFTTLSSPLNLNSTIIVREVDANGNISTVAGGGASSVANGVLASSVNFPAGQTGFVLAADSAGNVYIGYNFEVLKVDTSNTITVLAGTGKSGKASPGSSANAPIGAVSTVAVDSGGNVYFGQTGALFMIAGQQRLVLVAGTGGSLTSPIVAGPATATAIGAPNDLAIDAAGNLYFFANSFGVLAPQLIRVDTAGNLAPIAGATGCKTNGDGGDSLKACFTSIQGLAIDPKGNIYIDDGMVHIRELSPYDPTNPPPFLSAGGVVGAGGSLPAVAAASPNGLESLFGTNFVAASAQHTLQATDLVNGKIPTTLAGVCVSLGGTPAAMFGVYPNQLNVQVPALPPGPVTVQVTMNCGKSNAVTSNYGGVVMQSASPEFFSFLPDPIAGKNSITAINALTYALVGPAGLLPGATLTPAKSGEIVEAYGTGWGATNPTIGLGVIPGGAVPLALPYSVTFGGVTVPSSSIIYAGASPCCAGLYQLDFTVPAGTSNGNQPLVINVGGVASPPQAYIAVQQ